MTNKTLFSVLSNPVFRKIKPSNTLFLVKLYFIFVFNNQSQYSPTKTEFGRGIYPI